MKLWYFEDNGGNFGDALNPWFWSQVAPGLFDDSAESLLLGIGTIINHKLPPAQSIAVFGSGAGYGDLPKGTDNWKVYCVRGPLTAAKLGLDSDVGVIDPAALCPRLYRPQPAAKRYPCSFIPHYMTAQWGDWAALCEAAGIHYIDPTSPPLEVIDQIVHSDRIITEAMHGAILADSYRVPWMAVARSGNIHSKWQDWLLSVGLEDCSSVTLEQVWRGDAEFAPTQRVKNRLKRVLGSIAQPLVQWTPPPPVKSSSQQFEQQCQRLADASRAGRFILSPESVLESKLDRLEELLEQLRLDHQYSSPGNIMQRVPV